MMMVWNLMRPLLNKKEDVVVLEVSVSEISWDISVENPQVHVIEDTGLSNAVLESHTSIPNIIKAFLNQWLTELTNNGTLSLQHQVVRLLFSVAEDSSDTIQKMLSDVSLAISSLTNRKTRDQIMILNSKRNQLSIVMNDSEVFCPDLDGFCPILYNTSRQYFVVEVSHKRQTVFVVKEHASYGEITESKASSTSLFFDTIAKLFLA
ncbi:CDK5RAP3-like protein [Camellia lanceoleosa]|nr:CDK5RAP3-like protein [Camellia lanceoleosa]